MAAQPTEPVRGADPPISPERIVRLLRKQHELYLRLQDLSHRQRGLITGDHPEQLLSILHDRQSLVNALAQINVQLSPLRADWTRIYHRLPPEARSEVTRLLEQIHRVLHAILRTDQEDSALLSARRQSAGQSLNQLDQARAVGQAYLHPPPPGAAGGTADLRG